MKISRNSGCPVQRPALSEVERACLGGDFKIRKVSIHSAPELVEKKESAVQKKHPPKRRGEMAELAFMRKAISLGFGVAKPWGDSDRYDFILDSSRRLWRAQVRSTEYQTYRGYAVHTYVYVKKQMVALTARDVDVIIAYIVPLDLWYVVPIQFADCKSLWFYPHGSKKGSRFERFREAWHLLK